jgi:transcription termination factor NusB
MAALLSSGLMVGCAKPGSAPGGTPAVSRGESLRKMDPARIQADIMGFADRFVTAMTDVYDELERQASTTEAKEAAHQLKTDMALGAISNAVNTRPIAGMMDMVVMVTLLRQIAEDPWSTRTFGPHARRLVDSLKRQETDVRSLASKYLTNEQLEELNEVIQQWHGAHPDQRYVSHIHLADMPEANRPAGKGVKVPSVFGLLFFDPAAVRDPVLREIELSRATSERMFYYLQRVPLLLQWQVEGFYRRMLAEAQLKRVLEDVTAMSGSATRFSEASSRFTEIVGRFPDQLSKERHEALRQFSSELARQRDAAIRQLADAVAVQREAAIAQATTRVTSEREEAIRQMASVIRQEQATIVSNLEAALARSIDRLVVRLAVLVLVALALGAVASLVYRTLMRRRRTRLVGTQN